MSRDDEFAEFVGRHQAGLYRFAVVLMGSASDGEDLLQTVLAKTYARWSRSGVAQSPVAYVRRALVNGANSARFRSSKRHEQLVESLPESAGPGVEQDVLLRNALNKSLQQLSRQQRTVIALRFLADQSEAQVASHLGCSVGTVKAQASRGLARLRADADRDSLYYD